MNSKISIIDIYFGNAVIFMYQSDSFYISWQKDEHFFKTNVITAFKILADIDYYHYVEDEEKGYYRSDTISFIRCFSGEGEISLYDGEIHIKENECLFLNFHDIKKYKSLTHTWGYKRVNFTAENVHKLFEMKKIYSKSVSEDEEKVFLKFLRAGQAENVNIGYMNTLFSYYLYSLMLEEKDVLCIRESTKQKAVDEICGYIQQKIYSKISISEISSFFQISPRRLHQIFTQKLNISPKRYVLNKKLEEGYKLLVQTSIPVSGIAAMLCFSSPYHFSSEFKNTFGYSPTEVRKLEN